MYEDYLLEKKEDLYAILKNKDWISSYQIFLQSLKLVEAESNDDEIQFQQDKVLIGGSLRTISKSGRYLENSFSISEVGKIKEIQEPKSTQPSYEDISFPQLKKPNSSSITGDFSKNINMKANPTHDIFDEASIHANEYQIPISQRARLLLEDRLITNDSSIDLIENSLKSQYQISTQFTVHNTNYFLDRSTMSRSLSFDFENLMKELVQATILRIKSSTSNLPEETAVLLHPQVLSKLLSNFFAGFNFGNNFGKQLWSNNIQVYDDPLRSSGFYSTLFDDEGTLTRPVQLVSDGVVINRLKDLESTFWKSGGNGYRVQWFQPVVRSYRYDVIPTITNLILTGGTGKGESYTQRPGKVLLVRKAYSYSQLGSDISDFILHVNEAELFDNGYSVGPVNNFSIIGNLNEILTKGQLSSDQVVSVDPLSNGSIYSGWLVIPPSTVVLRS